MGGYHHSAVDSSQGEEGTSVRAAVNMTATPQGTVIVDGVEMSEAVLAKVSRVEKAL